MLQIKTIRDKDPAAFDEAVNTALADGWTLARRLTGADFIAEMEKEIITEAERCCENCKHCDLDGNCEPCRDCNDGVKYPTKWEAAE